jgi:phosphocarrier protein FPr
VVGIVVVSHSRALATAAVALAQEMVSGGAVRIAIAAGLDERTFGTDAVAIGQAITEADDGDGVVVLMDLGSAVLSAELAVELLGDEPVRSRVTLCPGPLVEGLVVAAVTAAVGASRAEVAREAAAALAGKQSQLGTGSAPAGEPDPDRENDQGAATGRFELSHPHGLHARPASRLVQLVGGLDADVRLRDLTSGRGPVEAGSLSRLATLGALPGHVIEVTATGDQAEYAVGAVLALAERDFDESGPDDVPPVEAAPTSATPGMGPAWVHRTAPIEILPGPAGDPDHEWARLTAALDVVRAWVSRLRDRTAADLGEPLAAVFEAHLQLLADPALLDAARSGLATRRAGPAWEAAVADAASALAGLTDPYLRARAEDVRAIGDQVLRVLVGPPGADPDGEPLDPPSGAVLVVDRLTPAQAVALDRSRVAAVVTAAGSAQGHAAILLRAKGIPAVVGAGPTVLEVPDGTVLTVDAGRGTLAGASS